MPRRKDITGQRFGRLTALLETSHRTDHGLSLWVCKCDCGRVVVIDRPYKRKSCGCLRAETMRLTALAANGKRRGTANQVRNRTRNIWRNMLLRCSDAGRPDFHRYGGRGIRVCDRWRDFENFYADIGPQPYGQSLDRINNDGNYEPGNCRWATRTVQNNNTSRNRPLTAFGRTQNITAWARELGIHYTTIWQRLRCGWPIERALTR